MLRSESLAIADLGAAIYDALDYSLANEEQRTLSTSLENLIDKMTSAEDEDEDNDEGIEAGDEMRQSGLMWATKRNHVLMVRMLLKKHSRVNF